MRRALAAAVLGSALLLLWLWRGQEQPFPVVSAPVVEVPAEETTCGVVSGFRYQLEEGVRLRYRVRYRATYEAAVPGLPEGVEGALDLDVDLSVTGLRPAADGASQVELRLGPVRRGRFEALTDGAALDDLDGIRGWSRLDPCGGLGEVTVAPNARALAAPLLAQLAAELSAPLAGEPGEASWVVDQASVFGRGPRVYSVAGAGGDEIRLRAARAGYDQLRIAPAGRAVIDEGADVTLDRRGYLARVQGGEDVRVEGGDGPLARGRSQVLATLEEVGAATAPAPPAQTVSATAQQARLLASARERVLDDRIAGLTEAQLRADLLRFGPAGRMPDHDRWLWRATGLLHRHPKLTSGLVALAQQPGLGDRGLGLVVDLLANVGHSEAQAGLRNLLASGRVHASGREAELIERWMLVRRPEPESVSWLAARFDTAGTPAVRHATALALGAAAGHRVHRGDGAAAALLDPVVAALEAGGGPTGRRLLVGALGNAGLPAHEPAITASTADEDPAVRAAAATALRRLDTPSARATLLALVTDPSAAVQRAALTALSKRQLTPPELHHLAARVDSGHLVPAAWPALLTLLAAHEGPAAAAVVHALQARDEGSTGLRAAIARAATR